MKEIIIGYKRYRLCENAFDMNDKRFMLFKQYLLQTFEQMDKPVFASLYAKFKTNADAGKHSDNIIEMENFRMAIELKQLDFDAYSFCFSLLCLGEGEESDNVDENFHIQKLEIM